MRKWFRIAVMIIAVLSILCLAACGDNNTADPTNGTTPKLDYTDEPAPEGPATDPTPPVASSVATEPTEDRGTRPTNPEKDTKPSAEIDVPVVTIPTTTNPAEKPELVEKYEWYKALSGQEQMAFMETFPDIPAFVAWYHEAEAAYKAYYPSIELGPDTTIDIGG